MQRTNIAHVRDSLGIYGAERVILTLAKHMDSTRFHFILLCMRRKDGRSEKLIARAMESGIHVIPIDVNGRLDLSAIRKIRQVLKDNNVHICHAHDYKSVFYSLIASANLGIKRIVTAHGSTRDSLLKKFYLGVTEGFFYRFVDKIIAVSEELRTQLQNQHIKPERIDVIQNGIDFSLINSETRKTTGQDLPYTNGRKVFGVIGRLFPDKGHRFFLEAFSKVRKQHPQIAGFIVGAGPAKAEILRQVQDLGLEDSVFLCGERSDMKAVYDRIDYLVIPSLREGLPYVLLEGMACKIPVLATAVGDIPLLIEDGVTGHLITPGDAALMERRMIDLLEHTTKSERMVEKAHSLVTEKYSAERMTRNTETLYTNIMA
jgi:glycosyltransferase involved in cell wall biosynthesis